jgi:hypothetical protein
VGITGTPRQTAEELSEDLWRLLRQLNLRRTAQAVQHTDFANAVDVRLRLIRDPSEFATVVGDEKKPCRTWEKSADAIPSRPIEPGSASGIKLTHCDRVDIEIVNRWSKDVEVTLLYLDSEGGIGALGLGDEPRVKASQAHFPQKFHPVRIVTWCDAKLWSVCENFKMSGYQPIGTERLIVCYQRCRFH